MVGAMPSRISLRRSPHGERGLKFKIVKLVAVERGRSPHGERGLKCRTGTPRRAGAPRRSPHGERGLKYGNGQKVLHLT